ncbi:hypothetical protein WR25_07321 [Diploscapter pachys]|uniref:GGDEF domain-containing protein n=1 Tax=Diploscapter pachys TaxID=2018661 RepID=A0A2A2KGS2_9BILA|nr:hypothetical protein WR25_07321 [Diploscapter pachys]
MDDHQHERDRREHDMASRLQGLAERVASMEQEALGYPQTLRAAIEACPFHFKGERVVITTSIGISAFRSGERSDQVLKRADEALYRAKADGRNRVEQA